jgi:hypothetical protein
MANSYVFSKRTMYLVMLAAILITLLLFANAFSWYQANHQNITRAAIELLPEWERSILGNAEDSLIQKFCMYPDWHRNTLRDGRKEEAQLFEPYVHLPLLQDLGKWHKNEDNDSEICYYIVATSMSKAIENLQASKILEAAKYLGPLVHFIEDNASPVHVIDNKVLAQLLPVPEQLEPFALHRTVEQPTFLSEKIDYSPQLLGLTVHDAAAASFLRFKEMRILARATSAPILKAIYDGNRGEADKGRAQAALPSVKLIADVIHTIFTIALDKKLGSKN